MRWKLEGGKIAVMGLSLFILATGINFPFDTSVAGAQTPSDRNEQEKEEKKDPQSTQPILPPTNDPEMVIKPDSPPDPDAVVTPPVVDPEMAVDPATRQPMTPEKLERITPEELEKDLPERKR